jgi:hypothetical protein
MYEIHFFHRQTHIINSFRLDEDEINDELRNGSFGLSISHFDSQWSWMRVLVPNDL